MGRYVLWDALFKAGRPNKLPPPDEGVLSGEAARANLSCHSVVDLRDPKTISALNLTKCRACHDALARAREQAKAEALLQARTRKSG